MTDREKKIAAINIFKESFPGLTGFSLYISEANSNEVDFIGEAGLYCTINIRSRRIKGI
ncbi:MAG: hypothetical protein LBS21_06780 [Clostridiales bacterium]|jgi:hypothetical protein|nr:hypothetical protein [Clostridiales bacterium]